MTFIIPLMQSLQKLMLVDRRKGTGVRRTWRRFILFLNTSELISPGPMITVSTRFTYSKPGGRLSQR